MNKQEFIENLRAKLSNLPDEDIEERIGFYSEMIDDRMEEGLSEEEAVLQIGSENEIEEQIPADTSLPKQTEINRKSKKRLKVWVIVLLALGSPIWLSLAIAAFAVLLSLYAVLWSLIASLWAVFASLIACVLAGVGAGILVICHGNVFAGIALIGAGILSAGLSIFLFFGCLAATKGTVWLTKRIALWIKNCFVKKENAR